MGLRLILLISTLVLVTPWRGARAEIFVHTLGHTVCETSAREVRCTIANAAPRADMSYTCETPATSGFKCECRVGFTRDGEGCGPATGQITVNVLGHTVCEAGPKQVRCTVRNSEVRANPGYPSCTGSLLPYVCACRPGHGPVDGACQPAGTSTTLNVLDQTICEAGPLQVRCSMAHAEVRADPSYTCADPAQLPFRCYCRSGTVRSGNNCYLPRSPAPAPPPATKGR